MRLREQKGLSLIEVLIGLSILGVVIIALLAGLITAVLGVGQVDQRTMALNLARSQIEYIKSQDYIEPISNYAKVPDDDIPARFTASDIAIGGQILIDGVLQQITVTVTYDDGKSVQLDGYRTNR